MKAIDLLLDDTREWVRKQPWYKSRGGEVKVQEGITEEGKKAYFDLVGKEWEPPKEDRSNVA